jgi:hypothetical protein
MMQVIDKAELEPLLVATLQPMLAKLIDNELPRVDPILCGVREAAAMIGRSPRFITDGVARKLFRAVKSDGRMLLVVQSLKDYVAGLPAAKGSLNPVVRKKSEAEQTASQGFPDVSTCTRRRRPRQAA